MIIGGQILDETGLPLPGANMHYNVLDYTGITTVGGANVIKKGTTTDKNGNWQLDVDRQFNNSNGTHAYPIVSISFIGFKTVKYNADRIPSTIKMQVDTSQLNNVDVYGKAKTAGMGLAGKLLLGGLFLGLIAKAIPSIMADNKGNKKGLNGFKKVSL